ncbi:MAG TPA: SDR family NAD(P)-dependent oxidoreductase [Acidimicrobiia bacterium]
MQIAGSTILVTGASSGIGAELAPQLAEAGATVGIVARRTERLEQVLDRCRAHAPASRMWAADLSDLDRAAQVALQAWDAFGHLDCLVNNAAIPKRTPLTQLTAADVTHVMDVDFHSPVRMGMAVLPRMLERGSGEIVNVSSLGGRLGIVHEAAYCAAKFALCGWTEVMAIDLHDTGVTAKLVLPGPIATEIWDQPGNEDPLYDGPLVPAADCAADIVRAIEDDGFEFYAPAAVPGGFDQRELVIGKTQNPDSFLAAVAEMARSERD